MSDVMLLYDEKFVLVKFKIFRVGERKTMGNRKELKVWEIMFFNVCASMEYMAEKKQRKRTPEQKSPSD